MTTTTRTPTRRRFEIEASSSSSAGPAVPEIAIPQYTRTSILGIWAAAALPMGALAWIGAPRLADALGGQLRLTRALIICIAAGLAWQFVLVLALVWREQGNLRWTTLRDVLWLRSPRSPRTGRTGGRLWLLVLPLTIGLAAEQLIPRLPVPATRDLGAFLESDAGQSFLHGAWAWFALIVVMLVLNTVLGEALLFRGFLLPRMNGAFGDRDWVVNGMLFAAYHLHEPWVILPSLAGIFTMAYPTKRYRSALMGIAVHSGQTVFFTVAVLTIVL
ncbi:MAG TPA: CPBP family intramembrane glutamic endopeptidase [Acidimicrobiales bacterium]|nr:CPBP family intramembrane glutamic endopeptidase [Acidimicrobiales bacterium]